MTNSFQTMISKVYFSKGYFCKVYPAYTSSKLCEFIKQRDCWQCNGQTIYLEFFWSFWHQRISDSSFRFRDINIRIFCYEHERTNRGGGIEYSSSWIWNISRYLCCRCSYRYLSEEVITCLKAATTSDTRTMDFVGQESYCLFLFFIEHLRGSQKNIFLHN